MLSKCYESTIFDRRTWLHVPSGTHWSTSSDTHQVVEIYKETSTRVLHYIDYHTNRSGQASKEAYESSFFSPSAEINIRIPHRGSTHLSCLCYSVVEIVTVKFVFGTIENTPYIIQTRCIYIRIFGLHSSGVDIKGANVNQEAASAVALVDT